MNRNFLLLPLLLSGACSKAPGRGQEAPSTPITYPASDYYEQTPGKRGGTLCLSTTSDSGTLDVQVLADTTTKWLGHILYDSLVYLDNEGRPTPWLAKSREISPDGKTYTFHQRNDVTFSDGTPFDAEALRINLKRIRDPATRTRMTTAYIAPYVDGKVLDRYTFETHLSEPYTPFLNVLAQSWFGLYSPKAIQEDPKSPADRPTGSGPFVLERYERQQGGVFIRRPDYNWAPDFIRQEGPAYLDRIELSYLSEPLVRFGGLSSSQHDFTVDVPLQYAAAIRANPELMLTSRVNLGNPVRVVTMNTQKPPFDDVRVRKAVALAIDRAGVERITGFGEYRLKTDYLSATTPFYDPSFQEALRDPRATERRTESACALPHSSPRPRPLATPSSPFKRISSRLASSSIWSKSCQPPPRRRDGNYQLTGTGYWHTNTPDGLHILYDSRNITSARFNGQHSSRLKDTKLDALLGRARKSRNPAELQHLYSQAQQRLTEVVPAVPVYENHSIMAWRRDVKNVVFDTSHNMPIFTALWMDR